MDSCAPWRACCRRPDADRMPTRILAVADSTATYPPRTLDMESGALAPRASRRISRTTAAAVVDRVRRGSVAANAGLQSGDQVVAIGGLVPRDGIDVAYQPDPDEASVVVRRNDRRRTARLIPRPGEDLGLEFARPTFDGIRRCTNACDFCFIANLPVGMRNTLYIKDDDYRYSFLYGSFVTLTNLTTADEERICYQRLSPLRVSVHATD